MIIQTRDIRILEEVNRFGCLTTAQISALFCLHLKVSQRRLRKLLQKDYLRKVSVPTIKSGRSPYLFYLGSKGAELLDSAINKPRLTLSLSHQIKNSDILIRILLDLKDSCFECEVMPEHLIRMANSQAEIIQDGAFVLRDKESGKSCLFFLENCSGTIAVKSPTYNSDIESRFLSYVEVFTDNDIALFENFFCCSFNRFRLLYITNNAQRLSALYRIISEHDKWGFIWLASLNDINKKGIAGNIWNVAAHNKSNLSILKG